jgi:outer membrane protein OmpA-like peptidoglycan-associated protein
MMKKIITLFTIAMLSTFSLTAQNKATKKADKHFSRLEFVDAAKDYLKLAENGKADTHVYSRLGDCYYNVFNTTEAENWYAKALEGSQDPEMTFKYAEMLKANGKYSDYNTWMGKFASMRPGDDRATAFRENPDYLPKILEKGKKFNVQNLGINSAVSDFGGTLKDGKLYITSARNSTRKNYGWNEQPFLDIYQIGINSDGSYQTPNLLNDKVNTKYHEGLVAFSTDGKTMYFSRESFYEKVFEKDSVSSNKYGVLHLYKATKLGDDWDIIEGFAINSQNYSVKNPSVSTDGKSLYFSSDKPGGYGKFDIYKAAINADGSLGEAQNLGQKVNTEGQEMFPFISGNGTLYFSSNGHLGLGGMDVFFTKEIDGKVAPVRNVGLPVNSNADDFAFRINEETSEGFVSSNREGGQGSDDIYAIKKLQPLFDVLVSAKAVDNKTDTPLSDATVTLYDSEGNKVISKQTNAEGIVEFIIEAEKDVDFEITMDEYESRRETLKGTLEEEVNLIFGLDPIEKIIVADRVVLNPIYFDYDKSNITSRAAFELDKLVQIMGKYPDLIILAESHTDSRGSAPYNERLSSRRAKTTVQYVISKGIDASRISGIGKGENEPTVGCGANCTEEEHQLNRRSEFIITAGGPTQNN